MTKKIFRSIIFGSVITLLVSFVFIMGILYEYFNNQLLSELRNEATLAELGVEEYGVDYLENIDLENRVTWIDKMERCCMTLRLTQLSLKIIPTERNLKRLLKTAAAQVRDILIRLPKR